MSGVVPFNRTGYTCNVPGTAHRPFPTVSLNGFTSAPVVPTMTNAVLRLLAVCGWFSFGFSRRGFFFLNKM